jgi:RNA polymerase primary sigma factor
MALRFHFLSSETPYSPGDNLAMPVAQPGNVDSESDASELDSSSPPEPNAAPALDLDLASAMNQARLSLLALLLENPKADRLLAEHLGNEWNSSACESGADMGETIVQDTHFVQQNILTTPIVSESQPTYIVSATLINIAQRVATENSDIDDLFRLQLQESRLRLMKLRQKMIADNSKLVGYIAYKYRTTSISYEDLIQEGMIGLIKAVDRFDPERGIRFSTYAVFWIKQAISRLIIKQEKVVHLPVGLAEKAPAVNEILRNSYLENNRWPSAAEIKIQCNLSIDEIKLISSYFLSNQSLDAALSEDNAEQTFMDTLKQQQFPLPLNDLINNNLKLFVGHIITSLPEKEAAILNMRFGLKNHSEMTLQAIADQLHVTRERVRQIQNQALQTLKQQFGYELLPFLESNDI